MANILCVQILYGLRNLEYHVRYLLLCVAAALFYSLIYVREQVATPKILKANIHALLVFEKLVNVNYVGRLQLFDQVDLLLVRITHLLLEMPLLDNLDSAPLIRPLVLREVDL